MVCRYLYLLWLLVVSFQATSVYYSDIPILTPLNSSIGVQSMYSFSTVLPINLTAASRFQIGFSYSMIQPPTGSINCSYLNRSTGVYVNIVCSCSNSVCTVTPGTSFSVNYLLLIQFGNFLNPPNVNNQPIAITVNINSTHYSEVNATISSQLYLSNSLTINSFVQSDFSVGTTNVTYAFNFSVGDYVPQDPVLQILLPSEIGFGYSSYSCNFFGTAQTSVPYLMNSGSQKVLTFYFRSASLTGAANRTALLTVTGFVNPMFIGNSSTFAIIMKDVTASNCAIVGCTVSELKTSLSASSNTSGDIPVYVMLMNTTEVNQPALTSVKLMLYAPIPMGGKVLILLPPKIQPVLPVVCSPISGYKLTDTNPPTCTYNSTSNSISTVNFAYQDLVTPSTAFMSFGIINPPDSSVYRFDFQTLDEIGRIIGSSRRGFNYSAEPGTLTVSALRNDTTVDAFLKLSFNVSFENNLTNGSRLQVVIPSEMANITGPASVTCITTGLVSLNCTNMPFTGADNTTFFNISFTPVCSQGCSAGNFIAFSITGLRNPSYINPGAWPININSVSQFFNGVIDNNQIDINTLSLTTANSQVTNVSIGGSYVAGTDMTLSLTFSISLYFQTYDGVIVIYFPVNASFVSLNTGVLAVSVVNGGTTTPITSSYQYYDNNMMAISSITISGACLKTACGSSLTVQIQGITFSYSTKSYSPYNFTISTSNGAPISQGSIPYPATSPTTRPSALTIGCSSNVTGSLSNYNFSFVPSIPIDSQPNGGWMTISLPTDLDVSSSNGCNVITNVSLGFSMACTLQNRTATIGYVTGTPQALRGTMVSLLISNTNNPQYTMPLAYKVTSYFNGAPSEVFSGSVSMTGLAVGISSYAKTNNTYNTSSILSIIPTFAFPVLSSDSVSLHIHQSLFAFTKNFVTLTQQSTLASGLASAVVVLNATHQIVTFSPLWNSSTLNISLQIVNPTTTQDLPEIWIVTKRSNFSSQQATVKLLPCDPMVLGGSVASSARVTGDKTNLTIAFSQNVNSVTARISVPANGFDYSSALLPNSSSFANNTVVALTSSPTTIVIRNLTNKADVSTVNASVIIYCLDINAYPVEVLTVSASTLTANTPKTVSMSGVRSIVDSAAPTNLTLNITNYNIQTNLSTIRIDLPANQFWVGANVTCSFVVANSDPSLQNPCQVTGVAGTSITAVHPCSASKCANSTFQLVVSGTGNLYADSSLTNVTFLINGSASEASTLLVTPPVTTPSLTNASIALSSNTITQNNTVSIVFSCPLSIPLNSTVTIQFDDLIFLANGDCKYSIGTTNYTGCSNTQGAAGYVLTSRLNTLGMSSIPANTSIQIQLPMTNSYAAYNISQSRVSVVVNASNFTIGVFTQSMRTLLNADTFMPTALKNVSLGRNTTACGQSATVSLSLTIPVNFYMASILTLMIPKDEVSIPATSNLTVTNGTITYSSEDSSYYYYSLKQNVCQSNICFSRSLSFSIDGLVNNNYPRFQPNAFMVGLVFNNTLVAPTQSLSTTPLRASQASITASRSKADSLVITNITINLGLIENIGSAVTVLVSTNQSIFYGGVSNAWIAGTASNTVVSYINQVNGSYLNNVSISAPSLQQSTALVLQVTNSALSPISGSNFNISIFNSSLLFYTNSLVPITNEIVPYAKNITLTRSVSTVASLYSLSIAGSFDVADLSGYSLAIGTVEGTCGNCVVGSASTSFLLNSSSFSLTLTNLLNPQDTVDYSLSMRIASSNYVFFSSPVPILPALTPISFDSQVSLSNNVVYRTVNITVSLQSVSGSEVNVTFPSTLFTTLSNCYLGSTRIPNCSATLSNNTYLVRARAINMSASTVSTLNFEVQLCPTSTTINASVPISVRLPYSVSTSQLAVTLIPETLPLSISSSSYTINAISTISVSFSVLGLLSTYTEIRLPFNITGQYSVPNCSHTQVNDTSIRIVVFNTTNLTMVVSNVTNPADNRPMTVRINQISNSTGTLVGVNSGSYRMTELGTITVVEALRNSSNLNAPVTVSMAFRFDNTGTVLSITLLPAQVYYIGNLTCLLGDSEQPCTSQSTQVNITGSWSDTRNVSIVGFSNSKSSQKLTSGDSILVQLYNQDGYQVASNKVQSFLIPEEITGNLTVSNYQSTSRTILTATTLSFAFALQNALTTNNAIIIEQNTSYVLVPHASLNCFVNDKAERCSVDGNQTSITVSDPSITGGLLKINGLHNGIGAGLLRIRTVDVDHNADIDSVVMSNPIGTYNAFPLGFRIIMASNTIGTQSFMIVMDTIMPKLQDRLYTLQASIQNAQVSSSWLEIDSNWSSRLNSSITLQSSAFEKLSFTDVTFTQRGDTIFSLSVYSSGIQIANGQQSMQILSDSTNNCVNVDCDKCAYSMAGAEMCLTCRENKVSLNGNCVDSCPNGMYSQSSICQKCSAMCATCFGPTSTECLSCQSPLIDNSGFCTSASNCTGKVESGYCLNDGPCAEGCKKCSPTQFCYECEEDYAGIGLCMKVKALPSTFFSYFIIPTVLVWVVLVFITAIKCQGFTSFLGVSIFSLAINEVICNVMLIPLANTLALSIITTALLVIRIVVSIASYQGYFKPFIYKDEQLIVKDLTHKDKLIGFFAHLICVDSYMLYMSKLGNPVMERSMPFAKGIKVFNIVNMLIRLTLLVVCVYFLSMMRIGDYKLVPIVCIASQALISLFHILANNYLFEKITKCFEKIICK